MSRSGYLDDAENVALWRGMVASAIRGKRGQQLLRDLVEALDTLPEKRLIQDELIRETGEVCALGAVGLKRGVVMWPLMPEPNKYGWVDDDGVTPKVAAAFNVAECLVQEITYINDEAEWRKETPGQRWERVRKWAVSQLQPVDIEEIAE